MNYLVEVKSLKKNYSSKEAVKGISFNIKENEILGLLGPNGSGKTTTIGMLLGLLKPSAGEIKIDNLYFEKNRIEILSKINFISPYIELPKKLEYGQVQVKVFYSGICGAQINEIDAVKGPDKFLPHLLGHEGSGVVEKIGEGVKLDNLIHSGAVIGSDGFGFALVHLEDSTGFLSQRHVEIFGPDYYDAMTMMSQLGLTG